MSKSSKENSKDIRPIHHSTIITERGMLYWVCSIDDNATIYTVYLYSQKKYVEMSLLFFCLDLLIEGFEVDRKAMLC